MGSQLEAFGFDRVIVLLVVRVLIVKIVLIVIRVLIVLIVRILLRVVIVIIAILVMMVVLVLIVIVVTLKVCSQHLLGRSRATRDSPLGTSWFRTAIAWLGTQMLFCQIMSGLLT